MPTPPQRQPDPHQLHERRAVGDRIRFLRRQRGVSQERLAALINRDRQSISNWELGHTPPSLDDLVAAARALGVPTWRLLRDE
ncbi:helix-turn-helix domain-containing protein [Kitasatospora sp. A2-31]|uniref:helix-turn-helix domain-containing protein n=1 Tax=Kitasatospora sp. A2-31 TaxID=2916414 RepID=UPI001EED4615|nr:helix-turn-helix transcriptional regulator [Kitasatospora sp. A2-31]MCG6498890.1 helix-turn-helix domain-containing protein [Kitasatospora sp. A2-31]MCG6499481.1 helix-turn-helix domain-containing protein [Kitasatospora sp. A2-31]MCG6500203.1 helix-turn-helix domain-containing protein [Kitasatospora sp. A2-31]